MVNAISQNVASVKPSSQIDDAKKLVKYVNSEALTQKPDTFTSMTKDVATSTLLFDGLPIFNLYKRNKKTKGFGTEALKTLDSKNMDALKKLFNKENGKFSSRLAEFISTTNGNRKELYTIKENVKSKAKADKIAKKALKNQKVAQKVAQEVAEATAQEVAKKPSVITEGVKKVSEKVGKVTAPVKKTVGKGAKAVGGLKKSLSGKFVQKFPNFASKMGKVGKFMKSSGAGIMLVFSGLIEGVTEVVPTFKELGKEKGMKQLGKSAVKVAGDTAGFIGGEMIGTAIGTAAGAALAGTKVGAAIGSVFPGFGTVIGGLIGCACGMAGSLIMGKITKKITGPSERELAKEQEQTKLAEKSINDKETFDQLKAQTLTKIEEEQALTGTLSEDSQIAQNIINKFDETNPFTATV